MYEKDDELYHYGKKGMKWGIRRSRDKLVKKVNRLDRIITSDTRRNDKLNSNLRYYKSEASKVNTKNARHERRLARATAMKSRYDLKAQKELSRWYTDPNRLAKYQAKSQKYNAQMLRAQKRIRYNKWTVKAEQTQVYADRAKAAIERNKRLKDMYSKTIEGIDSNKIDQGRFFMQYIVA